MKLIKLLSSQLLLILTLLTSCNAQNKTQPQETVKEQKTITNGLPKILKPEGLFKDAAIGCGLSDKAGNLWFGSNGEGIYRYNGKTFTHFTTKDGLDNNIVYSILEDKAGNIWVGTQTGLCRYDVRLNESAGQGKTFTRVQITLSVGFNSNLSNSLNSNPSARNGVWSMMQDKSGKIWFGADAGVYCYDGATFIRFLDDRNIINGDSLHLKAIFSIVEDKNGNIWFGSCIGEGLIRFDGKTLSRISPKGYARTQYITEDRNGNIWFGSIGKGMCRYDGETINTNFFMEKDTRDLMYLIWKDKAGNLWFCEPSYNRALHYYNGNENINFAEGNNLPDKRMYPILEDNNGNIWFASFGMKLYCYDARLNGSVGQGKAFTDFSE